MIDESCFKCRSSFAFVPSYGGIKIQNLKLYYLTLEKERELSICISIDSQSYYKRTIKNGKVVWIEIQSLVQTTETV